ncbi:aspartic peptidase domain-containing protein [Pilaira anomala]|nr:aspartic peptidase domain-containing protein [Pilaira anomala]
MNLVLDTGSSNTAVVSSLCQQCSFVQKPYLPLDDPNLSNTLNAVNVSYGNTKLRSTWRGFSTDQWVTLDDNTSSLVRIDAITENQSFFIPRCSENQGIWGLAYPSLQTQPLENQQQKKKTTLFDSLRQEKGIPNAFTIQICPKSLVDTGFGQEFNFLRQVVTARNHTQIMVENECNSSSRRQGHLWLGGYPSQSVGSEIVWVRLVHQRYYQVHIDRFLVNNQDVGMEKLNLPRTIVDTGTKDIVLSTENLQKLLNALWKAKLVQFDASVSEDHERSFWFDHAQLTLPRSSITIAHNLSLKIAFDEPTGQHKQVSIPIENILNIKPFEAMKGWVNISWTGFSPNDHPMASTILGNTLLRGKTVIFDRDSRIGFTDAPSSSCCQPSSGHDVNILLSLDDRQTQTSQKSLALSNILLSTTIIPHLLLALFISTLFL